MHTLRVKLMQHTPLIHFQHDQDGATLRASEVKPKLDRYILSNLTTEQRTQGEREGWIKSEKDRVWLDYKMRIEAEGRDRDVLLGVSEKKGKFITDDFPFLLANMGGKETRDELMNLSIYSNVKMNVLIQSDCLSELIRNNIETFFATHNFGQRQTKGFGSFSVAKIKFDNNQEETIQWLANDYYENGTPLMKFSLNADNSAFDKQFMLFSVIDFYWRCLKSGVNYTKRIVPRNGQGNVTIKYTERYIKAYLWTYLNSKGVTWEKRMLKNVFGLETSFPRRTYSDNANIAFFARGLMGCPDKYEYRIPQNTFYQGRDNKFKENVVSHTINIDNVSGEIERISSPIIFKPIIVNNNVSVYILFDSFLINKLNNLSDEDRKFSFSVRNNTKQLSITPDCIDYHDLIKKFHRHVFTESSFLQSTIGNYDENNIWRPARISIVKDEAGKVVSRNYGNTNISWKMIPRNFRWENILALNDKTQNKFVSFLQIVK